MSIFAKRSSKESVFITIRKDTVERTIGIKPVLSWIYLANAYPFFLPGFIIDAVDHRMYTYPHNVYVDLTDSQQNGYGTHKPFTTSKLELYLKPPFINGYVFGFNYLTPVYSPFGLSMGLNYHYTKKNFVSAELGVAAMNTGIHRYHSYQNDSLYFNSYSGYPKERKTAFYFTLMNNTFIKRFDIGYGIMAGMHRGDRSYPRYKMGDTTIYSAQYFSLGCSFSTHFRINNSLFAGFNYQPQFVAIDNNSKVIYEHLFNFGFGLRFGLSKDKSYVYK